MKKMKKYILLVAFVSINAAVFAQATKTDTLYLAVYNTGGSFMLKRAPYGEQTPKTDSVKEMVVATDSFVVNTLKLPNGFKPKTNAEIELLAPSNKTKPDAPVKPSAADILKITANAAKRTCFISGKNLKNKIVLIDYDKGCDQTDKCVQAQKAGAAAIIVIFDPTKKITDVLQSEEFDSNIKIPVFAVTSKQGDSIRMHLPSRVALYVKKPKIPAKTQNAMIDTVKDVGRWTLDNKKATAKDSASEVKALTVQNDSASLSKQISISPNPASDFINVQYNFGQQQTARVTVINSIGMNVYTNLIGVTNSGGTHNIETRNWESGVYIVAVDQDGVLLHLQKVAVAH